MAEESKKVKGKTKNVKDAEKQSECLGYLREFNKLQAAVLRRAERNNYGKGK
jgi:hypothetical protein